MKFFRFLKNINHLCPIKFAMDLKIGYYQRLKFFVLLPSIKQVSFSFQFKKIRWFISCLLQKSLLIQGQRLSKARADFILQKPGQHLLIFIMFLCLFFIAVLMGLAGPSMTMKFTMQATTLKVCSTLKISILQNNLFMFLKFEGPSFIKYFRSLLS